MVTSHDVARLAGVSQPTVSRALRGNPKVSLETRQRVADAAKALGYVPSLTGRALSMGRSHRVGLLVADLENQFYPHLIAPIHHELGELGYELVLLTESHESGNVADRIKAHGLDGVILATSELDSPVPVRLHDRGIPFVYFNRVSTTVDADSVTVDATEGVRAFVAQLTEFRHTRVGAIFGPANASTGLHRSTVVHHALREVGLSIDPALEHRGPFDVATGAAGARRLLDAPEPPTVIICGNDVVALGAFNEAVQLGVRIPDEVSIVGFDDLPEASWPVFGLSTVAFDLAQMARRAAGLLADRIEDGAERDLRHVSFPTTFVQRSSLGPAPH